MLKTHNYCLQHLQSQGIQGNWKMSYCLYTAGKGRFRPPISRASALTDVPFPGIKYFLKSCLTCQTYVKKLIKNLQGQGTETV